LIRHDIPTYHKHIEKIFADPYKGVSLAIRVGDLIHTRAMKHLIEMKADHRILSLYYDMLEEVTYGEIIDIYLSYSKEMRTSEMIEFKDKWKS